MNAWSVSRRWIIVLIATSILSGLSAIPAKDRKPQAKKATSHSTVRPIKAHKARKPPSKVRFDVPGTVKAATETVLSFRVPGLVESIPVKCGQTVKKGELVARLDTTHYQNQKSRAQARLKQAQAKAKDAETEYERLKKLWAKKDVSQRRLESARAAMSSAKESVVAAQKRLDEAKRQLEYAHLKAPYDGFIARIPGSAHENVGAGQPIARLVSHKLRFKIHISPKIWRQKDNFSGFECIFPASDPLKVKAELHSIGSAALPPHRLVPLEVALLKTGKLPILPGIEGFLRISVKKPESHIACVLPASAVVANPQGQSVVWVVNREKNTVQPKKVKTAGIQDGKMAIKSGIQPGQWVVTAGQNVLDSGQKVKITRSQSGKK